MTPLRQRFIDDMRLRNLSPQTIEAYVLAVQKFSRHFGKSPEALGPDDIRKYQLYLIDAKASWSQFNQAVCALRFLYNVTLARPHISNHRLVKLEHGRVTFRYKDYGDRHKQKLMTLDACEFLRRFVQHILPKGFTKIRHYGLLANRFRAERLELARRLLFTAALELLRRSDDGEAVVVDGVRERCCAKCGSQRLECVALPPSGRRDTS
jgi:hypothetical protein